MSKSPLIAALLAAAGTLADAQVPVLKPDAVEVKRIAAMATVQRMQLPARQSYDPQVKVADGRGCTFNIGDLASVSGVPGSHQGLLPPSRNSGVQRTEYVTVVNATPICVHR